MKHLWDERFAKEEYAYGKEPNTFFKQEIDKLNPGKLLLLGEGEGRNAVYAAKLGWEVDAVDWSEEGRKKAQKLADDNNVKINYILSDLSEYAPNENYYDAVGLIFLHLDPDLREKIHTKVNSTLRNGGVVILESYSKEQLLNTSGGPKNPDLLHSLEEIFSDFSDLEIISFSKEKIELFESPMHSGEADVIRFVGKKS
ncbi:MAG: class I SAM-dependent methyltransferase [Melioribacteraceae bacterium]|nr:MAG: class I SAM-dependent methyltransferase [Melioribacteraceae bacterium]